jgi:uncharacterized membrane protein YfcA
MFTATLFYILGVMFVTMTVRTWLGFGQALMALPLLALRKDLDLHTAAAVVLLVSLAASTVNLAQDWRHLHLGGLGWMMVAAAAGVPLGYWGLTHFDERLIKGGLALLLIGFSVYSLLGRLPPELKHDYPLWVVGVGFLSGVLGGAYGVNGPPLVIYGAMRRWSPKKFRTTLQGYFLLMGFMVMVMWGAGGMWRPTVMWYCLCTLPVMLLAVWLGRKVSRYFEGPIFFKSVYIMLVLIGGDLLRKVIFFHK